MKDCVEIIETKGIEEVGIYRVSSVVSEVHKMKELYSKSKEKKRAIIYLDFTIISMRMRKMVNYILWFIFKIQIKRLLNCDKRVLTYPQIYSNFIWENYLIHCLPHICIIDSWELSNAHCPSSDLQSCVGFSTNCQKQTNILSSFFSTIYSSNFQLIFTYILINRSFFCNSSKIEIPRKYLFPNKFKI